MGVGGGSSDLAGGARSVSFTPGRNLRKLRPPSRTHRPPYASDWLPEAGLSSCAKDLLHYCTLERRTRLIAHVEQAAWFIRQSCAAVAPLLVFAFIPPKVEEKGRVITPIRVGAGSRKWSRQAVQMAWLSGSVRKTLFYAWNH